MPVVTLTKDNSVTLDTYVFKGSPANSFSAQTALRVGWNTASADYINRSLLKFDLGLIPNDAIIHSATLKLTGVRYSLNRVINIHKVIGAWDANANWNNKPSVESSPFTNINYNSAKAYNIDITSLVQEWVNGQVQNNGLLLMDSDETVANSWAEFYSFDAGTNQPTLTIDYTIPTTGKKQVEYVGSGTPVSVGTSTKILTIPVPSIAKPGDFMVARVIVQAPDLPITASSGWQLQLHQNPNAAYYVFTKFLEAGETSATFSTSIGTGKAGILHVFRNVKAINTKAQRVLTSTANASPPDTTATVDRTAFLILNSNSPGYAYTPPLSYAELTNSYSNWGVFNSNLRYMYDARKQTSAEMISKGTQTTHSSQLLVLEPITNNSPTITLTSPADNQTLSEGSTMIVSGAVTDQDVGQTVRLDVQIDDAHPYTLGTFTATLPNNTFSYNLVYRDLRIYYGSTDIVGFDIMPDKGHTLKVTAVDEAGASSAPVTCSFNVNPNMPPTLELFGPFNNLLGTDGSCEDLSKFTYDSRAIPSLDSSRKTQGNNSIKITKEVYEVWVDPVKRFYPKAVDEHYIMICDVYSEAIANSVNLASSFTGVFRTVKRVSPLNGGYPANSPGQFVPLILALKVTSINDPTTASLYTRVLHNASGGAAKAPFNIDAFRVYRISEAQYNALGVDVDLPTGRAIADQYPYDIVFYPGFTLNIDGTASDADGPTTTVKIKIDNGPHTTITSGGSSVTFSYPITRRGNNLYNGDTLIVENLPVGSHNLTVWAEDDRGVKSTETVIPFTFVESHLPTVTVQIPAYDITVVEGETYTFRELQSFTFSITVDTVDVFDEVKTVETQAGDIFGSGSQPGYFNNVQKGVPFTWEPLNWEDKPLIFGEVQTVFIWVTMASGQYREIWFNIRITQPYSLCLRDLAMTMVSLGYPVSSYKSLNDVKPPNFSGPLSISNVVDVLE